MGGAGVGAGRQVRRLLQEVGGRRTGVVWTRVAVAKVVISCRMYFEGWSYQHLLMDGLWV